MTDSSYRCEKKMKSENENRNEFDVCGECEM